MSKSAKKWLITASFLVAIGAIIFTAVMTVYHWDFSKLNTSKLQTHTYEIKENFSNINLTTETADIILALSSDNMCKAVCREQEKMKYSVDVQNGTLTVKATDDRKWYQHIGINLHSPKVTVYLPKSEYESLGIKESTGNIEIQKEIRFANVDISLNTGDVKLFASVTDSAKINTSTGDIRVENISAGSLDLLASTGEITVSGVTSINDIKVKVTTGTVNMMNTICKSIHSNGSTGDIYLKNVTAKEKLSIERSTGDVKFNKSDADEIFVKTSTGNVIGTLLSEKVFITDTSTGIIKVPKTVTGGKCEIKTSTGDIIIKQADK